MFNVDHYGMFPAFHASDDTATMKGLWGGDKDVYNGRSCFLSMKFATHHHCSQFQAVGEQRKGTYRDKVGFLLARCSSVLIILTAELMRC